MSNQKRLLCILLTFVLFTSLFVGCSSKIPEIASSPEAAPSSAAPTDNTSKTEENPASTQSESNLNIWEMVYKSGDNINERAAYVKQVAANADYSYDDMSKSYAFDIIGVGTQADPFPANDVVKQWYKEKLNVDLNFSTYINADEADQQIMLRYASGNPPDYALISNNASALKLHKQGLIVQDWQQHIAFIPTLVAQAKDKNVLSAMNNGQMYGIPAFAGSEGNTWQTWIRADWLAELNMPMPQTPEDLLECARRFTEDDPDGNGLRDTWGFSSSGDGAGFGWIDDDLNRVFNIPKLGYVNGQLFTHDINPAMKDALAFVKTLSDNQWIDPDWYTQDWLKCYNKIRAGQVGIINMWLPGAMTVMEGGAGQGTGVEPNKKANGIMWAFEDWALVQTNNYKTSDAWDVTGKCWIAPKSIADDKGKFLRLLHMIDFNTAPNEGGMDIGLACVPAGGQFIKTGIGVRPDWSTIEPPSMTNYRAVVNFNYPLTIIMENILPWYAGDDPEFQKKVLDLTAVCNELPTYEEYSIYVTVPADLVTIQSDLDKFRKEAEINFVLGKRNLNEWDQYVDDYLNKMQGQKILDSYAQQLSELGINK